MYMYFYTISLKLSLQSALCATPNKAHIVLILLQALVAPYSVCYLKHGTQSTL